jgi:hypothetical protein
MRQLAEPLLCPLVTLPVFHRSVSGAFPGCYVGGNSAARKAAFVNCLFRRQSQPAPRRREPACPAVARASLPAVARASLPATDTTQVTLRGAATSGAGLSPETRICLKVTFR